MTKTKFLLVGLLITFGIYSYAVTPTKCWEDYRGNVLWCAEIFPATIDAEATCLKGALIVYSYCLKEATYPQNPKSDIYFLGGKKKGFISYFLMKLLDQKLKWCF